MTNREAARAFAQGESPRTRSALTFQGPIAWSYREPIAYRTLDGRLLVTTARFSMTTSHHTSAVAGSFAVEHGANAVVYAAHGELRKIARAHGQQPGSWGAQYDRSTVAA